MQRWYLVYTKPSNEKIAQQNLSRQGYQVYLPRLVQRLRRPAGWVEQIVPLFPRYVFLQLNEGDQSLGPVRSSVGVSSVVRFGTRYAVVPDWVIRDLHARADTSSGLHHMVPVRGLVPGAGVRITAGAFDGIEGIFEREAGMERVVVLLNLLGQDASVRIPASFVAPSQVA
jgi:transcriptional antiterminator RfaH